MLVFTDDDITDCYLHGRGVALITETGSDYYNGGTIIVTTILTREELVKLIELIDKDEE